MEFFLKYRQTIFRFTGMLLFVGGLLVYFWAAPSKVVSEGERAQRNIERMNAAVEAKQSSIKKKPPAKHKIISASLRETRKKQLRIFMLFVIFLGGASLLYSFFIKKDKEQSTKKL